LDCELKEKPYPLRPSCGKYRHPNFRSRSLEIRHQDPCSLLFVALSDGSRLVTVPRVSQGSTLGFNICRRWRQEKLPLATGQSRRQETPTLAGGLKPLIGIDASPGSVEEKQSARGYGELRIKN